MESINCLVSNSIINQLLSQQSLQTTEREIFAINSSTLWIYEWNDYWLKLPGVEKLRVGTLEIGPKLDGLFLLRFENQLGLAQLQPISGSGAVSDPVMVEVISNKFDTPQKHIIFLGALLNDLFQRVTRLPFTFSAETSRSVIEAMRPPTPLFTYHFLRHYSAELRTALAVILSSPHRLLVGEESYVPLGAEIGRAHV